MKKDKRIITGEKVKKTWAYRKAERLSDDYRNEPAKLVDLIARATQKAQGNVSERFKEVKHSFFVFLRLLKSYSKGDYRDIPWKSLSMIIACVIYFLTPLDFIPDFLATLGLLDDAALISWTLKFLSEDIERFESWEQQQKDDTDELTALDGETDKNNETLSP